MHAIQLKPVSRHTVSRAAHSSDVSTGTDKNNNTPQHLFARHASTRSLNPASVRSTGVGREPFGRSPNND
jgi:hypothetical protein